MRRCHATERPFYRVFLPDFTLRRLQIPPKTTSRNTPIQTTKKPHLHAWRYGFLFSLFCQSSSRHWDQWILHGLLCRFRCARYEGDAGGLSCALQVAENHFPLLHIQCVQSHAQRLHTRSYRSGGRSARSRLHHIRQGGDCRHERPLRFVVVVAGHIRRGMANYRLHNSQRNTRVGGHRDKGMPQGMETD